ncbi:hypothetical protein L1987_48539 [Smallanthus sonchifolius]|uniref:Uncharacterized protein n=1 Tax=Smallanthus sonchifolius TaxID=185202 RepID=A0ACB9FSV9_9ASTR|nr:hypothetical protein L1987_48539 [Smallanthus sonchifolius]
MDASMITATSVDERPLDYYAARKINPTSEVTRFWGLTILVFVLIVSSHLVQANHRGFRTLLIGFISYTSIDLTPGDLQVNEFGTWPPPPRLVSLNDYTTWKARLSKYVSLTDEGFWKPIEEEYTPPTYTFLGDPNTPKPSSKFTVKEKKEFDREKKTRECEGCLNEKVKTMNYVDSPKSSVAQKDKKNECEIPLEEEREASVADQEESATAVALMAIGEASCSSNEVDSNSFAVISCSKCLELKHEISKLQDKIEPLTMAAHNYKANEKRFKESVETLKKEKCEYSLQISEQQVHLDIAYRGLEKRNNEINKLQNEILQLKCTNEKLKNSRFVVEHYESVVRKMKGIGLGTNAIPPPISGKFVNSLIDIDLTCLDESSDKDDSPKKDESSSKANSTSSEEFVAPRVQKDKRPPVQKKGISKRQPGRIPKASLNVPKLVGDQHFETPVVKLSKPQKRRLNKRLRKLEREFLEGKFDQKPVSGKLTGERPNFSKPDFTEYSHKTVVPEFSKHQSFQKKEVQNKKGQPKRTIT